MAEADNVAVNAETSSLMKFLQDGGVEFLLVKDNDGNIEEKQIKDCDFLQKHCGLYFSAHWCPPCKAFTPKLAAEYTQRIRKEGLTIIFNSWDKTADAFNNYYKEMPWAAIPYKYKDALRGSKAIKQPDGIPSLYLFEKGEVYQTNGRAAVMDKRHFPYREATMDQCLSAVIDGAGNQVDLEELKSKKTLAIYFSAHWCPPCRGFTPELAKTYNAMVARAGDSKDFEFIFVSKDKDLEAFQGYFKEMPWKALNFKADNFTLLRETLNTKFGVRGIPALGLMTPDGTILRKNARQAVDSDKTGESFPWPAKKICDIDSPFMIMDNFVNTPSIILMLDNLDDKVQEAAMKCWEKHANEQHALGGKRECFHFTAKGGNLASRIRELCLQVKDDNRMILLDNATASYYVSELPESETDIAAFWKGYVDKTLTQIGFRS